MMAMLRHAEVLIDRPGGRRCHWKLKKLTATSRPMLTSSGIRM